MTKLHKPQISWEIDGHFHSLSVDGETGLYCSPDGRIIDMPSEGWVALAEAANLLFTSTVKSLGKRDSAPDRARFSFRVAGGKPNMHIKTILYRARAF